MQKINEKYVYIDSKIKVLESEIQKKLAESKSKAGNYFTRLDTLSPLKTLTRGYSVTEHNEKVIKSIKEVKENDEIRIRLEDGHIEAKVINVKQNK